MFQRDLLESSSFFPSESHSSNYLLSPNTLSQTKGFRQNSANTERSIFTREQNCSCLITFWTILYEQCNGFSVLLVCIKWCYSCALVHFFMHTDAPLFCHTLQEQNKNTLLYLNSKCKMRYETWISTMKAEMLVISIISSAYNIPAAQLTKFTADTRRHI